MVTYCATQFTCFSIDNGEYFLLWLSVLLYLLCPKYIWKLSVLLICASNQDDICIQSVVSHTVPVIASIEWWSHAACFVSKITAL